MNPLHAITLSSLQADAARLDIIALNLANVQTAGFKRQVAFTDAMQAASQAGKPQVASDSRPGTLKPTGQPLDVALAGVGFFEVLTPNGLAYTRAGNFSVDATGRLVNAQGHLVMGRNGDIRLATREPVIDAAGRITEAAEPGGEARLVDHLKVVRFDKPQQLRRLGGGLLAPGEGMAALPEGEAQVRQGTIENSNVDNTREMVELARTMRHFESVHRALQGYDYPVMLKVRMGMSELLGLPLAGDPSAQPSRTDTPTAAKR